MRNLNALLFVEGKNHRIYPERENSEENFNKAMDIAQVL